MIAFNSIIVIVNSDATRQLDNSFFTNYVLTFGGIPVNGNDFNVIQFIIYLMPHLFTLYIFSRFFREDFLNSYAYIITRKQNKSSWLVMKFFSLFLNLIVINIFMGIFFILVSSIYGLNIFDLSSYQLKLILLNNMTYILLMLLISYVQNFISLRFGETVSFFIATAYFSISILLSSILINSNAFSNYHLILFVPSYYSLVWHQEFQFSDSSIFSNFGQSLTYTNSLLILVFLLVGFLLLTVSAFNKLDSLDLYKEF